MSENVLFSFLSFGLCKHSPSRPTKDVERNGERTLFLVVGIWDCFASVIQPKGPDYLASGLMGRQG